MSEDMFEEEVFTVKVTPEKGNLEGNSVTFEFNYTEGKNTL